LGGLAGDDLHGRQEEAGNAMTPLSPGRVGGNRKMSHIHEAASQLKKKGKGEKQAKERKGLFGRLRGRPV